MNNDHFNIILTMHNIIILITIKKIKMQLSNEIYNIIIE